MNWYKQAQQRSTYEDKDPTYRDYLHDENFQTCDVYMWILDENYNMQYKKIESMYETHDMFDWKNLDKSQKLLHDYLIGWGRVSPCKNIATVIINDIHSDMETLEMQNSVRSHIVKELQSKFGNLNFKTF